jgi:hypothetical protein
MGGPVQQHGKADVTKRRKMKIQHYAAGREMSVASQNDYTAGIRSA